MKNDPRWQDDPCSPCAQSCDFHPVEAARERHFRLVAAVAPPCPSGERVAAAGRAAVR